MKHLFTLILSGLMWAMFSVAAVAQEEPAPAIQGIDYESWDAAAERIEALVLRNQARPFVLERARDELVEWRTLFFDEVDRNADRLTTIDAQLSALGPAPEEGASEAAPVADRRAELEAQREDLAAPNLLVAEANARAAGLISEIEGQLNDRTTDDMLLRTPSPLNPSQWGEGLATLGSGVRELGSETTVGFGRLAGAEDRGSRLFLGAALLIAAVVLIARGRRALRNLIGPGESRLQHASIAIADAIIPLIGLTALSYGFSQLNIFGLRGHAMLRILPVAGSVIILSIWLCRQFFPTDEHTGPLRLPDYIRQQARWMASALAWTVGFYLLFEAFLSAGDSTSEIVAFWTFPIIVVLGILLFRFATLLRTPPLENPDGPTSQGRTRKVIGGLAQAVGIIAPLLAVAGYGTAAESLLFPTILSLALVGVLVYFQSLANLAFDVANPEEDGNRYALVPVAIGFGLFLLSSPIFALIWGASRADLWAYWTRFTEGVAWGETQLAPGDVLWLILIFAIGYLLTQFIKTSLKMSVLPRTSLDLGAQNAIVAGFGYVGVFLSAVIAITSTGIDLSNLAIVAGALSVGIGFGLQTVVSNFVSGIILLIERPISEGDWIEVGGQMGIVRDISVRSTRIETFDRTDVIVPNADLVSNQVVNWTRGNLAGRLVLPVGVGYESNVDEVLEILRDIAENHPMVIVNPPPAVLFLNFGADALEFEIRAILRDVNFVMSTRSEINLEIAKRFREAGIEIPFAQRDIWLRNPEVLGHSPVQSGDKPVTEGSADDDNGNQAALSK